MITLIGHWKGWEDQATPMHSSCPTQRWKRTRRCQLHSGLRQGKGALTHPPTEGELSCTSIPAPLSQALEKQCKTWALPGASLAWHREALERSEERPQICLDRRSDQQTHLSGCFFFLFFCCFYFPLSYATVIRNIVIKQQVLF